MADRRGCIQGIRVSCFAWFFFAQDRSCLGKFGHLNFYLEQLSWQLASQTGSCLHGDCVVISYWLIGDGTTVKVSWFGWNFLLTGKYVTILGNSFIFSQSGTVIGNYEQYYVRISLIWCLEHYELINLKSPVSTRIKYKIGEKNTMSLKSFFKTLQDFFFF